MEENQVLVTSFTAQGEEKGKYALPGDVFGAKINVFAVSEAVKNHLSNARQGTAAVKGRSDVRGGGRKPWRQKGLGRARAGTNTSPIWVGGGRAFGPKPRDYSYRLPKKVRRLALHSALSSKVKEEALFTIEDMSWEQPKAKRMAELISKLGLAGKKCRVRCMELDRIAARSGRAGVCDPPERCRRKNGHQHGPANRRADWTIPNASINAPHLDCHPLHHRSSRQGGTSFLPSSGSIPHSAMRHATKAGIVARIGFVVRPSRLRDAGGTPAPPVPPLRGLLGVGAMVPGLTPRATFCRPSGPGASAAERRQAIARGVSPWTAT